MSHHLFLYMIAVLTVNFFPGPDMIYVISQSLSHGKRFGIAASLGISAGCFVHIFTVTVGLSSLLFNSSLAFNIIKYLGAAYLLYLGCLSLWKKETTLLNHTELSASLSWRKTFMRGFLTNALNPKVALFFLAFLPQFVITTSKHPIALQLLLLGLLFNLSGTIVNILIALCFSTIKTWLTTHPAVLRWQQKITGLILVGLGLRLAAFSRS